MTWTATASASPQNGGTATLSAYSGSYNEGAYIRITGTATPKSLCGWQFTSWRIVVERQDGTITTLISNDAVYSWYIYNASATAGPKTLTWTAYFRFVGTGKLVRSSLQPSKLIRVGNKLLRDD